MMNLHENGIKLKKTYKFNFNLSLDGLEFIHQLIYTKIVKGEINYTLTAALMEGLKLLQENYPELPKRISLERRYYKGGSQKNKGKIYKTSIVSTFEVNDWIEDYIVYRLREDIFFSKTSFVIELLEELKKKYSGSLLDIPKNM